MRRASAWVVAAALAASAFGLERADGAWAQPTPAQAKSFKSPKVSAGSGGL